MPYRVNVPEAIHQTIEGEVIAINLATGSYYSLRDAAAAVWLLLGSGLDTDQTVERLVSLYGASEESVRPPVEDLVERLQAEGLLVETDERPSGRVEPDLPEVGEFEPPQLERFDDMQDLILLDPVHEVDAAEGWPHVPGD